MVHDILAKAYLEILQGRGGIKNLGYPRKDGFTIPMNKEQLNNTYRGDWVGLTVREA